MSTGLAPFHGNPAISVDRLRTPLKVVASVFWVLAVIMTGLLLIHNQSILVWRVFNTNLRIVAPYLTRHEADLLQSKFASMRKRSDFLEIKEMMDSLAAKNNVKLLQTSTW